MAYDNQYYFLNETGEASYYMLSLSADTDVALLNLMSIWSIKHKVKGHGKVHVKEGNKSKFIPSDYHEIPYQMVSEKFKQIIMSFNLPGVDFYPTDITNNDTIWPGYYLMHIHQNYKAIHPERSEIDGSYINGDFFLESLSLNENVLNNITLEKRLVFRLEEKPRFLFHESVVEALKAANLSGLGFTQIKENNK